MWNLSGAAQTAGQVAPSDVDSPAAFVEAAGWQCLEGINLGGSATWHKQSTLAPQEVACAYRQLRFSCLASRSQRARLFGSTGGYHAGNWSLPQLPAH